MENQKNKNKSNLIMQDALSLMEKNKNKKLHFNENKDIKLNNNEIKKNKYIDEERLTKIKEKQHKARIFKLCLFYKYIIYQIKLILLVNQKTLTLREFSELLLNSSYIFKDNIIFLDKMIQIIVNLSIIFNEFFAVRYNSIIGYVVILLDKNFVIPDIATIQNLLINESN